jgi:hypothetical protein
MSAKATTKSASAENTNPSVAKKATRKKKAPVKTYTEAEVEAAKQAAVEAALAEAEAKNPKAKRAHAKSEASAAKRAATDAGQTFWVNPQSGTPRSTHGAQFAALVQRNAKAEGLDKRAVTSLYKRAYNTAHATSTPVIDPAYPDVGTLTKAEVQKYGEAKAA